jgi:hypothetical protein
MRFSVSRGFTSNALPIIMVVTGVKDYSYTRMHFQFKCSFTSILHAVKTSSTRGRQGLLRALRLLNATPSGYGSGEGDHKDEEDLFADGRGEQ